MPNKQQVPNKSLLSKYLTECKGVLWDSVDQEMSPQGPPVTLTLPRPGRTIQGTSA